MKVAFLTHEPFYPPSGGGSAEAVYLVRELVKRGHEIHLFCPKLAEPEFVRKEFRVRLYEFKTWRMGRYTSLRSAKYMLYPFLLRRMVEAAHRAAKFDLILSQHAISAVAAGWLKRSLRVPVAMNFLDYLTGFMETWPAYLAPPPLLKRLEKFELSVPIRSGADAVLTVSDTLGDHFAKAGYPRERLLPIYYGYDADLFPFSKGSEAKSRPKTPAIVMHGSLDHHHLGPIALGAIRRVVRDQPESVFRFVGQRTGRLENFLQRVRAEIPSANVESTGFVPYANVAAQLADASAGIVPYEESTGTHCAFVAKIVEYLAVGLPVVSTPLDSARRYFGNEPRVRFSGFDGESFGEKILSWLREPDGVQASQAKAASERVRAELDWRVISQKAIDRVEQIVGTPRGS